MCLQGRAFNLFAWARQATTMASCELAPKEAPAGQDTATFAGGVQLLAQVPWDAVEHSCFWDTRPAWNGSWHYFFEPLTGSHHKTCLNACFGTLCLEIMSCT